MKEVPATVAIRLYPLLRRYHFNPDSEMLIGVADEIVVLICQSFRDQELDEELGVVGRESTATIVDAWLDEMILMGATDFIALRKEEEALETPRYCDICGSGEHYTSEH